MKTLIPLLIAGTLAANCFGGFLYTNNFDSDLSLNGCIVGQIGTGAVALVNGQLRLSPGAGYLNRCYAALSLSSLPGYQTILASNPGMLVWAFNVSNSDGGPSQNNMFKFGIFSSADADDPAGYGYEIGAGGYVGDFMTLYRGASALSPFGPVSESIVNVANGLSPLPQVGAVKLTYNPADGTWSLYFEQHDVRMDSLSITTLVGSGVNKGFVSNSLRYVFFESQNYGSVYIDNFSISARPKLQIAVISPGMVQVSWPTNYSGDVLQSALTPSPASWQSVTNVPVISGNKLTVKIATTNAQQFFRLISQ